VDSWLHLSVIQINCVFDVDNLLYITFIFCLRLLYNFYYNSFVAVLFYLLLLFLSAVSLIALAAFEATH
jgi:hypothetical protein